MSFLTFTLPIFSHPAPGAVIEYLHGASLPAGFKPHRHPIFPFILKQNRKFLESCVTFSGYWSKSLLPRRVGRLIISCLLLKNSWRSFYFSLRWLKNRSPLLKWTFMLAGILSSVITQRIFLICLSSSPERLPQIYWKVILAVNHLLKDLKMPAEEQSQHPQAVLKALQYM